MKNPRFSWLCLASLLGLLTLRSSAQETVLLREVFSRELTVDIGGAAAMASSRVESREIGLFVEKGKSEALSREYDLAIVDAAAPPALTNIQVTLNATGTIATLDWSSYNALGIGDIQRYDIYLSDAGPFTSVVGLSPYSSVSGSSTGITLEGLAALHDHFFAVVAVDALGHANLVVQTAAAYILSPQAISREVGLFVGAEATPLFKQTISREMDLVVANDAAPPRLTDLSITVSASGDVATLDWSSYNFLGVGDVQRFDIYLSDGGPFTSVAGRTPFLTVGGSQTSVTLTGLTPGTDHFFAVVPVDGRSHFDSTVNFSAAYVLTKEIASREVTLFIGEQSSSLRQVIARETSIVVPDAAVPAPVTGENSGFSAVTSTSALGSVDLDWTSYNEFAQIDVARYRIYVGNSFFSSVTGLTPYQLLTTGRQTQTVSGLVGGRVYHFAVVAEDVGGRFNPAVRSFSAQASISGVGEVINLTGTSNANSILLSWQPPADAGSFVRGYRVYPGSATTPVQLPASTTSYLVEGLSPATGYTFRVTTLDPFNGESGGVSLLGATLLPNPGNVQLTARGGQVVLTWSAAQPAALVSTYEVYQGNSAFTNIAAATRISSDSALEATLGFFAAVSGKHFAVITRNVLGGSNPAVTSIEATKSFQTITFTPPVASANQPIPLQATASSGQSVRFEAPAEYARISGASIPPVLVALKGGLVTITAQQDGNANFWPADPVTRTLRLPPVITSFSASGVEIAAGLTLRQTDETLRVVAPDAEGIAQAEFFLRPAGSGAFTSIGADTIAADGLSAVLPVDAYSAGAYELKVVVTTPSGFTNEVTRTVNLQLGAPSPPTLTGPENNTQVDTPTVTVTGTALRGSQVSIFREGVSLAGPLTVTGGAFSAVVPLIPGTNTLVARASNAAGTSADSNARVVTLRSLLTLEVSPASVTEGAGGTVRVLRNHSVGVATVSLNPSVAGQLTLPATVTLAPGANQASVAFTATDNKTPEADQGVMITGSASGYTSGTTTVTVLDDDRANLPDLTVTSIIAPAQAAPGAPVELTWTVKNLGPGKAAAGSTDQIFLSTDAVLGGDQLVGTAFSNEPLASGLSVERRATVTVPSISAGARYFVVRTNAGGEIFEEQTANNSALASTPTTIKAALKLDLTKTNVPENNGSFLALLTRNGDLGTALSVTLSATPAGTLLVPATVLIPAGESSATISLSPVNDDIVTGSRTVTLTVQAADYPNATGILTVTEDDAAGLAVEISPGTVVENATNPAATGTVRRNTATTGALTVGLVTSDPTVVTVPASVVIPAGASSAPFPITVIDNDVLTGPRTARITASAPGLATSSATLQSTDDDIPGLTLRLTPGSVNENALNPAVSGRLIRDRAAASEVVVRLTSSAPASVVVPAEVKIPLQSTTVDFPITIIDNDVADGARDVVITATETDSVLHLPIAEQAVQATLHLFDNEGASLALSASAATVVAGQTLNGTVTRQPGTTGAITVALASSNPALTVPASVVLANGAASANFSIAAPAGATAATGVTITASASGLNSAALGLTVITGLQPDLTVTDLSSTVATAAGGSSLGVSWMVANDGSAAALGSWTDRVYLSTDRQATGGAAVATVGATGPLAPGSGYARTAQITLPTAPGRYWLVVRTDTQDEVSEGAETNNALVAALPIDVQPAYRVTVATDVELAFSGTPVPVRGKALRTGDETPVAQALVSVRVLVNGTRRVLGAVTDVNGDYLTTFRPLPSEAGHYSLAAAQPDVATDTVQDQFDLIGLAAEPNGLELRLALNQPVSGDVVVRNLSDRPLTGLTAVLQGAAANISAVLTPPGSVPAHGTATLHYALTAANATITRAKVGFHVTSAEGAVLDVPVQVTVLPIASQLVANPGTLNRGMLRGAQSFVDCELVNLGAAPTGDLAVELPNFPWLRLASPGTISSLAPGERVKITLQLLPAAELPLQLYTGSIFIRAAQSGLSVPFQFRAISEAVGDVTINVLDDYTYYTPGAPRVADATVKLRDPFDQSIIVAQGLTDAAGKVTLPTVREGSYFLEVTAAKHGTYRNGFVVVPGIDNAKDIFISRQTVTYTWQVVPTEIPDRYEIKLVATFEVDVPVPVVTMEVTRSTTIPELQEGESIQVDVKLENHGLIAAEQVSLHVPGPESGFEFRPLITSLDFIAAKSSVTIPMIIRRPLAGVVSAALAHAPRFAGGGGGGGGGGDCPFAFAVYSYECGADRRYHQTGTPFTVSGSAQCGGPGSGGGFPFVPVGEAGPGGAFITGPGVAATDDCDPCGGIKIKAIAQCIEKFLPFPDWFKCGKGVYTCYQTPDLYKCVRTGMTCAKAAGYSIPFGKPLKVLDCIYIFIKAAEECDKKTAGGGGGGASPSARTVARYQVARNAAGALAVEPSSRTAIGSEDLALLKERAARMQSEVDGLIYLFGDAAWIFSEDPATWQAWIPAFLDATEVTSDGGERITAAERQALLALPLPFDITAEIANRLLDRNNRNLDYYATGIFNSTQVPANSNPDFVARDILGAKFGFAVQSAVLSEAEGFSTISEGLLDAMNQFRNTPQKKTQGVCARVKIEIDQQAVLTRQAFSGTLEVTNSSETSAISGVSTVLDIRDANGNSANDQFFIRGPEISGLANASGQGQLAAGGTARLQFTFIPKNTAAVAAPTVYNFAGTLQYVDAGQPVALPLLPSPITVYPDARLTLKYFQQRDVYSDDPFTPGVEPAEPFALGLIVTNAGRGIAKQMKITSAQPKIIDNKKGLLIDFKIIGTQVGADSVDPSLTVDLGDIEPGESQVAQFLLTASLQGKFIDYQASFEHGDELGGASTSLIDSVEIHELIHPVRDDRAGADGAPDFLVNDVKDANSQPDTLYLSSGAIAPVNPATSAAATIGTRQGLLTANQPSGWSYLEVTDPGAGLKLARVVRSDGKVIRVGDNAWQTDRSFPNSQTGATRERLLHLLDFDGTGSYTLFYTEADGRGLLAPNVQVAQFGPVVPAVRATPLDTVDLTFTRPIDPGSFTGADVFVRFNDGPTLPASGVVVTALGEAAYRLSGLAGLNASEGTYTLTVQAHTVADVDGRAGLGSASAIWVLSTSHLAVVSISGPIADVSRAPVTALDVLFSQPADPSTVSLDDFSLTRDGGLNLLGSATRLVQTSPTSCRLENLGPLTAASGTYLFTARASTINDATGVAGVGALATTFVIDVAGPAIAALDEIAPNPRSAPVNSLDLTFTKTITLNTFTSADVSLRRNGKVTSLGDLHIVALDDRHFRLAGLAAATGLAGSYQLEIDAAGVTDQLGNPGVGKVQRSWSVSVQPPVAPTKLAITPDRGVSATDRMTNTSAVTIIGGISASAARVRATDQTRGVLLGEVGVAGKTFALPVQLATAGLHRVAVETLDATGRTSTAVVLPIFVDLTPPAVTIEPIALTPRDTPVTSVTVNFSEAINPATFTVADLSLKRDGAAIPLSGKVTLQAGAGGAYVVNGLAALTDKQGYYELSISAEAVEDLAGNKGPSPASISWRRTEVNRLRQFGPFTGSYLGVILNEEPRHATSGIVRVTLTRTGSFTAAGVYGGRKFTSKGLLDADGKFTGLSGKGQTALRLSLTLITDEGANALVGSVTGSSGEAEFVADRLLFSKQQPTPLAAADGKASQKYVVVLAAAEEGNPSVPAGDGFALVTVDPAGKLKVKGEFADGTKFSQSTSLAGEDGWPFYVPLDKGKSSAVGSLTFRTLEGLSDLDGTIHLFRAPRAQAKAFAAAFSTQLSAVGSVYQKPAGLPVFNFGNATQHAELVFSGSTLAEDLTLPLTLNAQGGGVFDPASPTVSASRPKFQLSLTDGRLSGSVLLPGDTASTTFHGVAFPKQQGGSGYFLRLENGGVMQLRPAP